MTQEFNEASANKVRMNAKRALAIVDFLEKGMTTSQIIKELPEAERSLVDYYRRRIFNK